MIGSVLATGSLALAVGAYRKRPVALAVWALLLGALQWIRLGF